MQKTVVVGMSGGVDSSVAAALLIEQGYRVLGLFMHNWEEEVGGQCHAADDFEDAKSVCGRLNIPVHSINFSEEYLKNVFEYFLSEYKKGRTPNPDVLCNREIKFGPFLNYAKLLGADYVATGHYCALSEGTCGKELIKARDELKDQTYFLNQVKTAQLADVLFPLGKLTKPEVRQIAEKYGFVTAKKKDSTGICFIGERKFKQFLAQYLPAQRGKIVDLSGREVGSHDGLMFYTLGQRRGLNIGGIKGDEGRWYVVEKRLSDNVLVVSCGEGEELLSRALTGSGLNIIGADIPDVLECGAKFRYRQAEQKVLLTRSDDKIRVEFAQPQRAITPGQYAVFYLGERCIGGAVIDGFER